MEYFILGLLMVRKLTAYELHVLIRDNYEGICSSSIGNIQRALKKLHEKGFVSLEEITDGKVVKKIFSITPEGRGSFMNWLNNPIDLMKAKNMELGRLLMLGFLTKEQQLANIDIVIQDLREACGYIKAIEEDIKNQMAEFEDNEGVLEQAALERARLALFNEHQTYMKELLDSVETDDFQELLANVTKFGLIVLRHGSAEMHFNLEWFENLRKELLEEAN